MPYCFNLRQTIVDYIARWSDGKFKFVASAPLSWTSYMRDRELVGLWTLVISLRYKKRSFETAISWERNQGA